MSSTSSRARVQRARVAALTRHRDPSDPELKKARFVLREEALVSAVERAVASAPPMTKSIRDRVMALLFADSGPECQ